VGALVVSNTKAYRQFGNSVVVPVVECLAEAVIKTLHEPALEHEPLVMQFGEPKPEDGGQAMKVEKPKSRKRNPASALA